MTHILHRHTHGTPPVAASGDGPYVIDTQGNRYIDAVTTGASVEAASETLDDRQRRSEGRQLTLRTRDGVERSAFDDATLELVGDMVVAHPTSPDRVVLTRAGRLMANDISVRMRD